MSKKETKTEENEPIAQQRTSSQNRALHKFCELLAKELNDAGLDMRVMFKPTYNIPWTTENVKNHIWRPFQKALYDKESTTFLRKQEEIDKIHKTIMRELGEKKGVPYIPFPNDPKKQHEKNNYSSYEPADEIIDYPEEDLGGETPF